MNMKAPIICPFFTRKRLFIVLCEKSNREPWLKSSRY